MSTPLHLTIGNILLLGVVICALTCALELFSPEEERNWEYVGRRLFIHAITLICVIGVGLNLSP